MQNTFSLIIRRQVLSPHPVATLVQGSPHASMTLLPKASVLEKKLGTRHPGTIWPETWKFKSTSPCFNIISHTAFLYLHSHSSFPIIPNISPAGIATTRSIRMLIYTPHKAGNFIGIRAPCKNNSSEVWKGCQGISPKHDEASTFLLTLQGRSR